MPYSTGLVRRVDPLGRIVLPVELRRTMNIDHNDSMEIYVDEDKIIIQKYDVKPNYEKMWKELKDANELSEELVNQLEGKYAKG